MGLGGSGAVTGLSPRSSAAAALKARKGIAHAERRRAPLQVYPLESVRKQIIIISRLCSGIELEMSQYFHQNHDNSRAAVETFRLLSMPRFRTDS